MVAELPGLMPTLDIYNNSRPKPKEKETLYSDLLKKFLNKFPELKIAFDGDEEGIEEKRNNIYRMIYSFKSKRTVTARNEGPGIHR